MSSLSLQAQEQEVLRWGGVAGMLGSVVFIIVFVIVGVFVAASATSQELALINFPDLFVARIFENGLYLLVLILWSVHFAALFYALRDAHLAPALFGSLLGILGLVVMAAGTLPHVATVPVSAFYEAASADPAQQEMLIMMWRAVYGMFEALLIAGFVMVPFGLLGIGMAMRQSPAFSRGLSWASIAFGVLGLVAACVSLVMPHSPIAVISVFGMIIFHFLAGRRIFTLSRAT
ncbi:MAG: hypothetical protein AAF125_23180 [Chloroflexota bacterium]